MPGAARWLVTVGRGGSRAAHRRPVAELLPDLMLRAESGAAARQVKVVILPGDDHSMLHDPAAHDLAAHDLAAHDLAAHDLAVVLVA